MRSWWTKENRGSASSRPILKPSRRSPILALGRSHTRFGSRGRRVEDATAVPIFLSDCVLSAYVEYGSPASQQAATYLVIVCCMSFRNDSGVRYQRSGVEWKKTPRGPVDIMNNEPDADRLLERRTSTPPNLLSPALFSTEERWRYLYCLSIHTSVGLQRTPAPLLRSLGDTVPCVLHTLLSDCFIPKTSQTMFRSLLTTPRDLRLDDAIVHIYESIDRKRNKRYPILFSWSSGSCLPRKR
nr:hypothetical protein CFP56_58708 [Quercus suber]